MPDIELSKKQLADLSAGELVSPFCLRDLLHLFKVDPEDRELECEANQAIRGSSSSEGSHLLSATSNKSERTSVRQSESLPQFCWHPRLVLTFTILQESYIFFGQCRAPAADDGCPVNPVHFAIRLRPYLEDCIPNG